MNKDELSTLVSEAQQLRRSLTSNCEAFSVENYVRNNLDAFIGSLSNAQSASDISNAGHVLERFAVDSLEWQSTLFRHVISLSNRAFSIAKC